MDRDEELDVGPQRRRPGRRVLVVAGVVAVLAAVLAVVAVTRQHDAHPKARASRPNARPASTPAGRAVLPGATFVLAALTDRQVVQIEPGVGRVVRTTLPPIGSTGPVDVVVAGGDVLVRPLDGVAGYVIAPDGSFTTMREPLPASGRLFAGPDAGHVWVEAGDGHTVALATPDGRRTGAVIDLGRNFTVADAIADGGGDLVIDRPGVGVWTASPGGVRRISTGRLVATGPPGWLVAAGSRLTFVARDGAAPRLVGRLPPTLAGAGPGVVAPNGRVAAVGVDQRLYLVPLSSGDAREILGPPSDPTAVAWSPDGRWLIVVDLDGTVTAVDTDDHDRTTVLARLPSPVTQLAVSPTS